MSSRTGCSIDAWISSDSKFCRVMSIMVVRWGRRAMGQAPPTICCFAGTGAAVSVASPLIGVVMGSSSDWEVMRHAADILTEFGVPHETRVVSAHRTPDDMFRYAEQARGRGL